MSQISSFEAWSVTDVIKSLLFKKYFEITDIISPLYKKWRTNIDL